MRSIHLTGPTTLLRLPAHEQAARRTRASRPYGYAPIAMPHLAPPPAPPRPPRARKYKPAPYRPYADLHRLPPLRDPILPR